MLVTPGQQLLSLCMGAGEELLLVAPFATYGAVTKVLAHCPVSTRVVLVTRWRPEEVAAGVSDPRIIGPLLARGGEVRLHDPLHAKFYRSGTCCLVGSANLTATALGWCSRPNLEILHAVNPVSRTLQDFELLLMATSSLATLEQAEAVLEQASLLTPPEVDVVHLGAELAAGVPAEWVPSCSWDDLVSEPRGAMAREELRVLGVSQSIQAVQLQSLLREVLPELPLIRDLNDHLVELKAFGQTRRWLSARQALTHESATQAWQCLRTWLIALFPEHYVDSRPGRHSQCMIYQAQSSVSPSYFSGSLAAPSTEPTR